MPDIQPDRSGIVREDGHDIYWESFGNGSRETICLWCISKSLTSSSVC
jgi:hypothetical protein